MNGTDASEEPMDIPILSHFMLITGGEDDEAEGLARDYGMQVDVVIGPSHPRIRFITPLTQHDLDKAASPTDAARSALRRRIDSSQAMEFVHCSYHIALRAEAVYALGSFTSNYRQMEGDVGWTVQFAIQMQRPRLWLRPEDPQVVQVQPWHEVLPLYGKGTVSSFARKECYRGDEEKQ